VPVALFRAFRLPTVFCYWNLFLHIVYICAHSLYDCVAGVQDCEVLWSMCLFVCLLFCLSLRSHFPKTTRPNFTKFSVNVTLCPWLGPPLTALRNIYVLPVFVDDDIFSRENQLWRVVSSSSPGGSTGSEVCCLRLHLV